MSPAPSTARTRKSPASPYWKSDSPVFAAPRTPVPEVGDTVGVAVGVGVGVLSVPKIPPPVVGMGVAVGIDVGTDVGIGVGADAARISARSRTLILIPSGFA